MVGQSWLNHVNLKKDQLVPIYKFCYIVGPGKNLQPPTTKSVIIRHPVQYRHTTIIYDVRVPDRSRLQWRRVMKGKTHKCWKRIVLYVEFVLTKYLVLVFISDPAGLVCENMSYANNKGGDKSWYLWILIKRILCWLHGWYRTLQHRWLNVGYNLNQTTTFQQLLCLSNKISTDSFKRTYSILPYMFLNTTHF